MKKLTALVLICSLLLSLPGCQAKEEEPYIPTGDAILMEGEDPECVDKIVGGSVEFSMHIEADDDNQDSLLVKYVQDIWDTLTGDKPISAAGTEAPDYYKSHDVNWYNRRNGGSTEPTE